MRAGQAFLTALEAKLPAPPPTQHSLIVENGELVVIVQLEGEWRALSIEPGDFERPVGELVDEIVALLEKR